MDRSLRVEQAVDPAGELTVRIGHELADAYLIFLRARARPNTVLATAFDLKVLLCWARKEPSEVTSRDVIDFVAAQRAPRAGVNVVRISDGGSGLSSRTVARRLSSISGFFSYLMVRSDCGVNTSPVPRGLINRRARRNGGRATPIVRTPKLLPRI
ncbi:MAG TPA: site-specific integrase, partial [Acidimicrobiales bacterium]|nr:site-specific integrase [Acidimicrobiales bacterium]